MITHLYQENVSLAEEKLSARAHASRLWDCTPGCVDIQNCGCGLTVGRVGMPRSSSKSFLCRNLLLETAAVWILGVRIVFLQSPLLLLRVPGKATLLVCEPCVS